MTPYPRPFIEPTREELIVERDMARAKLAQQHDVELHRLAWDTDRAELVRDRTIVDAVAVVMLCWNEETGFCCDNHKVAAMRHLFAAVEDTGSEPPP